MVTKPLSMSVSVGTKTEIGYWLSWAVATNALLQRKCVGEIVMGVIGIIVFIVKVILPEILGVGLLILILFASGDGSIVRRLMSSFVVVAIYLFIRVGDPYLGKIYTQRLCDENKTFEVYKTVTIPASYWKEDGYPTFTGSYYEIEGVRYEDRIEIHEDRTYPFFEIHSMSTKLVNKHTDEILGVSTRYRLSRSWYERFIGTSMRNNFSCGGHFGKNNTYNNSLEMRVFQPEKEVHSK